MTCIVALIHDGMAYFAGDSLTVNVPSQYHSNVTQSIKRETKVFRKGDMLFGANGSVRMIQVLRYELEIPVYAPGRDKVEYLVVDFVKALRQRLKDVEMESSGLDGGILLSLQGELFRINGEFGVYNPGDTYESIGKAHEVAVGSLHTTGQLGLPPLQRLWLALEATEHHTCVVKEPYTYITDEMSEAEVLRR